MKDEVGTTPRRPLFSASTVRRGASQGTRGACAPRSLRERGSERDRAEKDGADNRVAGDVVPLLDRGETVRRRDPDEEKSAPEIGQERDPERRGDERDAPTDR